MKTVQLRRYEMVEGMLDEFIAWFPTVVAARRQYGFTLEFAYADRANDQFVWAVSHDGDEVAFKAAEEVYNASPERAAAFAGQPKRVAQLHVGLVDAVAA
jgi:hypothetical protein